MVCILYFCQYGMTVETEQYIVNLRNREEKKEDGKACATSGTMILFEKTFINTPNFTLLETDLQQNAQVIAMLRLSR